MTTAAAFTIGRAPLANRPRSVEVTAIEDVTPTYRRITLGGDFSDFDSRGADDHLRIFFVPDGFELSDVATLREQPSREYTPAAWTAESLTLDFVLHGDGPASSWAASATPGAAAVIGGPRGSMVIEGAPDWWLLAVDRTAWPAARRFAAQVAPGTPIDVIAIAEDVADEQRLPTNGELTLTWVRSLPELVAALPGLPARDGDGFAFIAAEQSVVKPGREFLQSRGIDLERAVVKGYWKQGEAEFHAPH